MSKRLSINLLGVLLITALFSVPTVAEERQGFVLQKGDSNPWMNLDEPDHRGDFRFAIVGDRAGGVREGVFAQAQGLIKILRPDFVMSVGDLVDGRMPDGEFAGPEVLESRWSEMDNLLRSLELPFFLVPGNNELNTSRGLAVWTSRFGRTYYRFLYGDVLFIVLNSEDPPQSKNGNIGEEQLAWLERTLSETDQVRWTLVFLHRPMWLYPGSESWKVVQGLLNGRKHTVFAGHHHRYSRTEIDGSVYYGLAVTGGGHPPTASERDSFDHLMWVTMSEQGPIVANLPLDGIWGDDPVSDGESDR
jgi:hypothetical protein